MSNMTVEDRLAEKLKSADFAGWFGEDDIRDLVAKALTRAFFTERPGPHYNSPNKPPLVVEMAAQHAFAAVDALVEEAVKKMLAENPAMLADVVKQAADQALVDVVQRAFAKMIASVLSTHTWEMETRLRSMITGQG